MKTNYYINVFDELSNGEWEHCDTIQTKEVDWLVVKDGVLYSCGHIAPTNAKEALSNNGHRYFQIAKSEPIIDYVIGTFDICRFYVKKPMFKCRYVIRVQLVNTREPYYFVQQDGKDWRFCRDVCSGKNMQELRAGMDKNFKGGEYVFEDDQERKKFESLL